MGKLHDLFDIGEQSPWLDNVSRPALMDGTIQRYVDNGIRGITSNPTIFQKAIQGSDAYDKQFAELTSQGLSTEEAYWQMAIDDISAAANILRPLHDSSNGEDGYVSIEVEPKLANNTEATIEAAKSLWQRINLPNIMIKIPATAEGIPAIEEAVASGINVNITLIFSLARYQQVIDAYKRGIARCQADTARIHSVASFFISRVDGIVDKELVNHPGSESLGGKAAIAQANIAYSMFTESFADFSGNNQRPLWASTSTKNPQYPDTLYVDSLIATQTVNTIPEATIAAFSDHGTVANTINQQSIEDSRKIIEDLGDIGIDLEKVAQQLEQDGVKAFEASFEDMIKSLQDKII